MFRPATIIVLCNVLLWTVVTQLNHYLAPLTPHLSLFAGGLMVAFPALRLNHGDSWRTILITGLFLDAAAAVHFGVHAILMLVSHVIIYNARSRFPRDETAVGLIVALLANAGIFAVLSMGMIFRGPAPFSTSLRLVVDLLASQLFVAAIGVWFFALQDRALEMAGVGLRRQQRGLL